MIEYEEKDFLWITPELSGNLLLGDKTEKELKEEEEKFKKEKLNEDS